MRGPGANFVDDGADLGDPVAVFRPETSGFNIDAGNNNGLHFFLLPMRKPATELLMLEVGDAESVLLRAKLKDEVHAGRSIGSAEFESAVGYGHAIEMAISAAVMAGVNTLPIRRAGHEETRLGKQGVGCLRRSSSPPNPV